MINLYIQKEGVLSESIDLNNFSLLMQHNYYYYLRPNDEIIKAVRMLLINNNDVAVTIVTKLPYQNTNAVTETSNWLQWYMPEKNYEVICVPLGSHMEDYIDITQNSVMLSSEPGELLAFKTLGGRTVGYRLYRDYGVESIISGKPESMYAAINNACNARRILSVKFSENETGYFRLNVSGTDSKLCVSYKMFDNNTGTFGNEQLLTTYSGLPMNYDCAEIDLSYINKPVIKGIVDAIVADMAGEMYHFYDDTGKSRLYMKFDMEKLKAFDLNGVRSYMEVSDLRNKLFSYMRTEVQASPSIHK